MVPASLLKLGDDAIRRADAGPRPALDSALRRDSRSDSYQFGRIDLARGSFPPRDVPNRCSPC